MTATGPVQTFINSAWRANIGYVLTDEEATKSGVTPRQPFNLSAGTWGAFEIVARVSGLELDGDFFQPVAAGGAGLNRATNVESAFAYGLGLNWYFNRNFRFLLNLENTEYDGAKTPTATVGARDDELAFITRAQLSF